MSPKERKFFWKGKRVSEKVYKKWQQQVQCARNLKAANGKFSSPNLKSSRLQDELQDANIESNVNSKKQDCDVPCSTSNANANDQNKYSVEGRRIIHMQTLGEQMFCLHCKSVLSLTDIKDEKPRGLASIFTVKCRSCKKLTQVFTDKLHKVSERSYHFDPNTKIVLGIMNGGVGYTHLNKVLTLVDVPEMNWSTYRSLEKEVCKGVEKTAEDACVATALEERRLTIEHASELKQLL